ncbi:MAG: hypothetical protein WD200_00160 [Candidatus Andersenbacteria bacterium]
MFKKSTVFISAPIRKRLEEEKDPVGREHRKHNSKGLWLALGFAFDIVKLGMCGAYAGDWAADDPGGADYTRALQYGEKYLQGSWGQSNRFSDAVKRAARIEAHVLEFPCPATMATEVIVTFYESSRKEPFMTMTAHFANDGPGGVISSSC